MTVEGAGGVLVIRGSDRSRRWNGIHYKSGMSSKNVGARWDRIVPYVRP